MFISLVMTLQYVMDMPTEFRTNIDVCICLRENINANRDRLYKYFYGQFPNQMAFNLAMDATTNNFGALVCANNLTLSTDLTESIFWFRAPAEIPPARLGHPMLWQLDARCYKNPAEMEQQKTVEVRNVVALPEEVEDETRRDDDTFYR